MKVDFKDITLFEDKTYDQLLKDIYEKSQQRSSNFNSVIETIIKRISEGEPAAVLLPLLAEYSEVAVKNDDLLIKIAGIVQRFFSKPMAQEQQISTDWSLPEAEMKELYELANKVTKNTSVLEVEIPEGDIEYVSDSGSNRNQKSIQAKSKG